MKIMPAQKGNILLPLISAFAIVAIVAAGYFFWQNQQLSSRTAQISYLPAPTVIPSPSNVQDETANWKTIVFAKYNFSMKIPNECWSISYDGMNEIPIPLKGELTTVNDPRNLLYISSGCSEGPVGPNITFDMSQGIPNGITKDSLGTPELNPEIDQILSTFKFL